MFNGWTLQRPSVPAPQLRLTVAIGAGMEVCLERQQEIGETIIQHFPASWGADGLWAGMVSGVHRYIPEMVQARDAIGLSRLISALQHNNLGTGIGWFGKDFANIRESPKYLWMVRAGLMDNLTSLAALIGIEPLENPEAGLPGKMALLDGDNLICRIDANFGYELRSPAGFDHNIGIVREGGVCDYRTLWAAASAERIVALLEEMDVPPSNARVLEIGGGAGNLAFQCLRHGIGQYTIVDLPTTRAIQTYIAMTEFPAMPLGFTNNTERLNLLAPDAIPRLRDPFHIIVNEDSLPEMAEETGRFYAREIGRLCAGLFLSLNHDGGYEINGHKHPRVSDLCEGYLTRIRRSPHWMRRGYVEEVFTRPRP